MRLCAHGERPGGGRSVVIGLGMADGVGWIHAAFRHASIPRTRISPAPPPCPPSSSPPVSIASPTTRAAERFSERLRAGRLIVIDGAEHEIMMERDALRDQFWAAFDAFIPGIENERTPT